MGVSWINGPIDEAKKSKKVSPHAERVLTRCLIGCFVGPTMDICKSGRSRASSCKLNLSSCYDFLLTLLSRYQLLFATSFIDAFPSNNGTLCWMKMQARCEKCFLRGADLFETAHPQSEQEAAATKIWTTSLFSPLPVSDCQIQPSRPDPIQTWAIELPSAMIALILIILLVFLALSVELCPKKSLLPWAQVKRQNKSTLGN